LTFTNKAAAEMKSRALSLAGVASSRIASSNFHTFGMRFLRNHGKEADIPADFDIVEGEEAAEIARNIGGSDSLMERWSDLRLRRSRMPRHLSEFGARFQAAKYEKHLLDFDDLIVLTAETLENNPEIARAYADNHRHLLIDEFQDTNPAQFAIVTALSPFLKTVPVFADDDQAIFQWAGAEAENIRRFITELGAAEYQLTLNYRTRKAIVDVANLLIAADPKASGRVMRSHKQGGRVRVTAYNDLQHEAATVTDELAEMVRKGVSATSIAVLVRSSFRAEHILNALRLRDLPVSNWLGQRYDSSIRRSLIACFAVIRGNLSDRNAKRLCELIGVSDTGARTTKEFFGAHSHTPGIQVPLKLRKLAWENAKPSAAVGIAVQFLRTLASAPEAQTLDEFVAEVDAFENYDPQFSLEHLLTELALGGAAAAPTESGGIKVATMHKTKGLQWPRVYLVGLEMGHMPNRRADTQDKMREERRLCFVGLCRAEDSVTLTREKRYDGLTVRTPSLVLKEMGL
jgi:DNA helicase-2/ATP-dependent DNA helicase PcrA